MLTRPDAGRRRPVRLTEVPEHVRVAAAVAEIKKLSDPDSPERDRLFLAALFPSNRVYWIRP